MELDLIYLCKKIGEMAGIPVRLYQGTKEIFRYSILPLPKDPLILYRDRIGSVTEEVGYFITPSFDYYGVLNAGEMHMVIGPARHTDWQEQELRALAFQLEVSPEDMKPFLTAMHSFVHMPLDSILMILCSMNYVINGTKLELQDLKLSDSDLQAIRAQSSAELGQEVLTPASDGKTSQDLLKTFHVEQQLTDFVGRGDLTGFEEWIQNAPSFTPGKLSADLLRQNKDNLIISSTIFSRAAIRSGMDPVEALSLCNSFIQRIERMTSVDQLTNLGYHLTRNYIERVNEIRNTSPKGTDLVRQVNHYVRSHLSENIRTEKVAEALFMSRSHLSTRFKKEAGLSLNEYIHLIKISEARHLLTHTDKSPLLIAGYLGYSSQSYFSTVFRRITGMTPTEYRSVNTGR